MAFIESTNFEALLLVFLSESIVLGRLLPIFCVNPFLIRFRYITSYFQTTLLSSHPHCPFRKGFRRRSLTPTSFLRFSRKYTSTFLLPMLLDKMPNYARFMKEVMVKKRKLEDYETIKLIEQHSVILQRKLPQKVKDPGSFAIPCMIGDSTFDKALFDLRESINLMPFQCSENLNSVKSSPLLFHFRWQIVL